MRILQHSEEEIIVHVNYTVRTPIVEQNSVLALELYLHPTPPPHLCAAVSAASYSYDSAFQLFQSQIHLILFYLILPLNIFQLNSNMWIVLMNHLIMHRERVYEPSDRHEEV